MGKIAKIKKELKNIQSNFNPQKSTYKTINNLINNNYSVNEMISSLSKIKGVSKYPDELKQKFIKIINDLKEIEANELDEKIRKQKELEKKEQEAKTKELKDLIDALETRKNNRLEKNIALENKNKYDDVIVNNEILDETKDLKKMKLSSSEYEVDGNESIKEDKLFKILLSLVIITFIIAIVIFFKY